jgi:hypothetical protein
MLSLGTTEQEDRVEEWLGVPMFFAGFRPQTIERLLRERGFDPEICEVREEVEARYGPTQNGSPRGRPTIRGDPPGRLATIRAAADLNEPAEELGSAALEGRRRAVRRS